MILTLFQALFFIANCCTTLAAFSTRSLKTSIISIGIKYTKSSKYLPPHEEVARKFFGFEEHSCTLHHTPTQYLPDVECILVHRHFTCKSKNPRILAPVIILEQSLKYKSCRVLKMVPNSNFFVCFLTSSKSTQ
jgi:hypothetical protein